MWFLWLIAGFAAGYIAHAAMQAVVQRRGQEKQRALGLCFGSVGGEPKTPAQVEAHMLRKHGLGHGC